MRWLIYSRAAMKYRHRTTIVIPRPKRLTIVGTLDEVDWIARMVKSHLEKGKATYVALLTEPVPPYVNPADGVEWAMKRGAFSLDEALKALYQYQLQAEKEGKGFITDLKKWRAALAQGLGMPPEDVHDAYINYLEEQRTKQSPFLYRPQ